MALCLEWSIREKRFLDGALPGADNANTCKHGWFWLVSEHSRSCDEDERRVAGWWYCDCHTHQPKGARCRRPYTQRALLAAMALAKLNGQVVHVEA